MKREPDKPKPQVNEAFRKYCFWAMHEHVLLLQCRHMVLQGERMSQKGKENRRPEIWKRMLARVATQRLEEMPQQKTHPT